MANTYTQIHIQSVFAPKYREAIIHPLWKDELEKYITGITQKCGHKMLAINSMPDHMHMFYGMRPTQSISQLMQIVKGESSEWINKRRLTKSPFHWQQGYGAFSYTKSLVPVVAAYVENQQRHHRVVTFRDEYLDLLKEFEIDHDDRFIFHPLI